MPILHNKSIMPLSLNTEENIGDVNKKINLNQLQVRNSTFWHFGIS